MFCIAFVAFLSFSFSIAFVAFLSFFLFPVYEGGGRWGEEREREGGGMIFARVVRPSPFPSCTAAAAT